MGIELILIAVLIAYFMHAGIDLAVTAAQVIPGTGALFLHGIAGEVIDPGETAYLKASDNRYWLADADASEAAAAVKGVCVAGALVAASPVTLQYTGLLTLGAAAGVTAGSDYYAAPTAGKIMPSLDLAAGDYVTYLGTTNGADQINLQIKASGIAHA